MKTVTANYHTHTRRCNHAVGADRDYVENAIRAGMKILGFSDHTPMIFLKERYGDYYSGFRMRPEQAEGYFRSVLDLKAEYKNEIEIFAGVETEYYPDCFPGYLEFMRQFPLDYMILAQHFVGKEAPGYDAFDPDPSPVRLQKYYEAVLEAVKTGLFLYVAHPDVINFTGAPDVFEAYTRAFLEALLPLDPVLEINQHGHLGNRNYPNPEFWRLAGEYGFRAIVGVDAHDPAELLDSERIGWCRNLGETCGLRMMDSLPICPPEL